MEVRKGEQSPELPPGFRFHPTDEELIVHYLSNQAISTAYPASMIPEVDLYKFDPWQLPEKADFEESERYFFTPRDRKYPNGVRPNRATLSGYWKATGTDKAIYSSSKQVGVKKSLVFYKGKPAKGIKTNWIMHEYRLCDSHKQINKQMGSKRLDDWVLCRIYRKKQLGKVLYDHKVEEPNNPMFDIRGANDARGQEVGKLPIESSISHPWESVCNLSSIFQFQSTSGNIAKIDDVGQSLYQLQTDHSAIGRLQVNPVANLNETMFTDPSGVYQEFH